MQLNGGFRRTFSHTARAKQTQQDPGSLTYSRVSDKGLLVGHDGVDGHLLEVLRRDDGDGRVEAAALTEAEAARHLLDDRDVVLVEIVHAPEGHRSRVGVCKESQVGLIFDLFQTSHSPTWLR